MSGIFAICNHNEAARMAYFGLYALQHRGQESAGIVSYNSEHISMHLGMGLVHDVFTEDNLNSLKGDMAIGHVRYPGSKKPLIKNTQPFSIKFREHFLSIAHDGRLINSKEIRKELEDKGAIFQTTADSEIFLHLIVANLTKNNIEDAIIEACTKLEGAYSLVIMFDNKIIGLRDPFGIHPLAIAKYNGSYFIASETCAFDLLQAEYIRSVAPGEMVVIENKATDFASYKLKNLPKNPAQCIFELVYLARPDSFVFGEEVYACRKRMGSQCAKEMGANVDGVMPFPDSGIYAALGVAQTIGAPYEHALIRNHYVGRTFIQPSQSMREFSVKVKLNPVKSAIKNKKLCLVDDSIVRGTTVRTRVAELRSLGASEVHFRVSSPPVKYPCYYGANFPTTGELIATQYPVEELKEVLGLDSLHYITLEGLKSSVNYAENYCMACFDNNYPTKVPSN